ncbi:MAG: hypothetical protein GY707_12110 [Desulfobacteraceae bacterium]|nr:hypothetical protein [Desulfobacteraceae bacterium]
MKTFNFWQKWLFGFGIYIIVFGLALVFFSDSKLFDFIYNSKIDPVFFKDSLAKEALGFRTWIYGVLGAVLAGWGVFISYIAFYPFRKKEKWAWWCVLLGGAVWIIPDMIFSLKFKVFINVISNITLYILMMLPVVFTYHDFHKEK